MEIIQPSATIIRPTGDGISELKFIEQMARISHRSEELQTEDSWKRFIQFVVMQKGDWSVVEHVSATVLFRMDRGLTHEFVRHRLFSFTQESTRFVNYKKKGGISFIKPLGLSGNQDQNMMMDFSDAERAYMRHIEDGASPQIARAVLPTNVAATISATCNLRNWRHFLIMRTTQETHPDLRRITIPLLKTFQDKYPLLYDDIVPGEKQATALSKPR